MNRINVHLPVPVSPDDNTSLWVHSLSIPLQSLMPLSLRPFKLLRYICFVLLSACGELSLSQDLELAEASTFPYDSPTVDIVEIPADGILNVYYHVNADDLPHIFPLDPQLERLTVTTSESQVSLRRADFQTRVRARDNICVATGNDMDACDVAHLIAVSKGDNYIRILTEARSVNHRHATVIDDINDTQNGLLLHNTLHRYLGKSIAFLPLPNEYMTSQDVDDLPERSYILHDLKPQPTPARRHLVPQGHPLRVSSQDWPPDILFDTVYATAVIATWSAGSHFKDLVKPGWSETFYGGAPVDKCDGGKNIVEEERIQATQRRQQQSESRQKRYELRNGQQATEPDALDIVLALQFLVHGHRFVTPTEPDTSESRSKVEEWLRTQQFESGLDTPS